MVFGQVPGEVELVSSSAAGQIKSMADIKGKTLGVTGLGASTNSSGASCARATIRAG